VVTASLLAGLAIGSGLWVMSLDNGKPILEAASPPARSHHSVSKPLERRASAESTPNRRSHPPRQPRPAHPPQPLRSDPKPRKPRDNPAAPATGILTLDANPWANVYLGDRLLGATPLVEHKLRAGPVTLRLVNPETGQKRTVSIDIPAGGILRRAVTLE
jgi:hypothetical protein